MSTNYKNQNGMALFLTIAVVAILSVLVLEFSYRVNIDLHIAGNFSDRVAALYAARSGINYAKQLLTSKEPGVDSLQDEWAQPVTISVGDATVTITITDEQRKINLNNLRGPRAAIVSEWLTTLIDNMEYPDTDPEELIKNMVDWIDPDDIGDAEDSYYQALEIPYHCKNRPLDSFSELKMIKDINDLILYGNTPYPRQAYSRDEEEEEEEEEPEEYLRHIERKVQWYEEPYDEEEAEEYPIYGLSDFVTVIPGEAPCIINMNTAPPEVLTAIVGDDILTDIIVDARYESPFRSDSIYREIISAYSPELWKKLRRYRYLRTESTHFLVVSLVQYRRTAVKVTALLSRSGDKFHTRYYRVAYLEPQKEKI
ncbi:hypothetical protein ES707_15169 [subsurface metagenome]